MSISRVRRDLPVLEGELSVPADGDLQPWLVMTQPNAAKPHVSAGWVDACDEAMAMQFARHHYGRDQKVASIWAMPRAAMIDSSEQASGESRTGSWQLITQEHDASLLFCGAVYENCTASEAWSKASSILESDASMYAVWLIHVDDISRTAADDLVWPLSDQSYRLARGYSKVVREKWDALRTQRDLDDYRKDDLKETF